MHISTVQSISPQLFNELHGHQFPDPTLCIVISVEVNYSYP